MINLYLRLPLESTLYENTFFKAWAEACKKANVKYIHTALPGVTSQHGFSDNGRSQKKSNRRNTGEVRSS